MKPMPLLARQPATALGERRRRENPMKTSPEKKKRLSVGDAIAEVERRIRMPKVVQERILSVLLGRGAGKRGRPPSQGPLRIFGRVGVLFALVLACVLPACQADVPPPRSPPTASVAAAGPAVVPRGPVVDVYHGVQVTDEYQWLEKSDDPEVVAGNAAQSASVRRHLDALPDRTAIHAHLAWLPAVEQFAPTPVATRAQPRTFLRPLIDSADSRRGTP
jgi:hypothetical protein